MLEACTLSLHIILEGNTSTSVVSEVIFFSPSCFSIGSGCFSISSSCFSTSHATSGITSTAFFGNEMLSYNLIPRTGLVGITFSALQSSIINASLLSSEILMSFSLVPESGSFAVV